MDSHSEILFQGPVQYGDNSRAASTEINKHACSFDNQHCHPFVCVNIAPAYIYIGQPFTMWQYFKGGIYWGDLPESAAKFRGKMVSELDESCRARVA